MNIISCRVLLVEDSPLDADLIKRALQKTDANVHIEIAVDGEEAIAHLQAWESGVPVPIFILLDLKLPKINGLEVLKQLKSHPKYKLLPVVVLTSSNEMMHIQQAYNLGANSYIIKAVDYDEFSNAIRLIHRYWCGLNIHPE